MSARRKATYADLLKVPDLLIAEILEGELVTTPRPAVPQALAASAIGSAVFEGFNRPPGGAGKPGGWWILDEPELHLGDDVVVPDVAGWRRADADVSDGGRDRSRPRLGVRGPFSDDGSG